MKSAVYDALMQKRSQKILESKQYLYIWFLPEKLLCLAKIHLTVMCF